MKKLILLFLPFTVFAQPSTGGGGRGGGSSTNIYNPAQQEISLGTIANGGTAAIVLPTNVYYAIFSGATATITLPSISNNGIAYWSQLVGTNTSGSGGQVLTFASMQREEIGSLVTTITNNLAAGFTITFRSSQGVWTKVDASGDALTLAAVATPGGANTYVQFNDSSVFGGDSGFIYNKTTDSATLIGNLTVVDDAYDATTWNGNNNVPTKNAIRDKIETIGSGGGSSSTTQTNFVLNQFYTNGSQTVLVRSTVALTGAAVSGSAALDLMVDQAGGSTFTLLGRSALATSITLGQNSTNVVSGIVAPLGVYYWTNASTGAGNSALIVAGTGQVSTTAGGSGGYGYLIIPNPRSSDGTGATLSIPTASSSTSTSYQAQFSASAATNGNYCAYYTWMPLDFDNSVELVAYIAVSLTAVDTAQHKYSLGYFSPANSAGRAVSQTGCTAYALFNFTDAAGASSDIEYSTITTTGFAAGITGGQLVEFVLARDGTDASTQASFTHMVAIRYKKLIQ